jgi:hypothetical protein
VVGVYFDVAQDLSQQPRPDVPPLVNGNGRPSAVRMLELLMRSF